MSLPFCTDILGISGELMLLIHQPMEMIKMWIWDKTLSTDRLHLICGCEEIIFTTFPGICTKC